jgi:hypothetical protein
MPCRGRIVSLTTFLNWNRQLYEPCQDLQSLVALRSEVIAATICPLSLIAA